MKSKKLWLVLFTLCVLMATVFALGATASAEDEAATPTPVETWDISATAADSVTAYLYNDPNNEGYYTLTISGSGDMKRWNSSSSAPWYTDYRTLIKSATIEEGVTNIGQYAFYYCSSLTNINISESVTDIGDCAFRGCTNLTNINIPENVISIGRQAFFACNSFTNITINANISTIADMAFYECRNLVSISLPESVISIGERVFAYCYKLSSINIPKNVTSIGYQAFYYCEALENVYITDSSAWCNIDFYGNYSTPMYYADNIYVNNEIITHITVPDHITTINSHLFYNFKELKSIDLPQNLTSIGNYAFKGCSSLTNINIPENVTSIRAGTFYGCSSLTSITIPENVTSIGSSAFYGCSSLTSITLPNKLVSIEDYAFRDCSSLTSINIPESVTSIGSSAFSGCRSLTSIRIPEKITSIEAFTFSNCLKLKNITISESVTSIGLQAFEDCISLTNIDIPKNVTSIETLAFLGCTSLTSVNIPESVTSIGNSAFYGCRSLTSIRIPENVTSIGGSVFSGCKSLTSITLPNELTSIEDYAFDGCSSLTSITLPNKLVSIGSYAFDGCSSLKSITISENVTSIGSSVFSGCKSLTNITLPNGLTSIGNSAFYGCKSLTSINIPEKVTSIGSYAFDGCSSLTSINIPEKVTSIGSYAFDGCSSLKSITLSKNLTSIGNYAFRNCSSLTSITIPENVTSIGNSAFSACNNLTTVYINSPTIASSFTSYSSNGYLTNYASTVAINSDITEVGTYVTSNYTYVDPISVSIDGEAVSYTVYSKHSHADDSGNWGEADADGAVVCSVCGLKKASSHKLGTLIPRVEPTCTTPGNIAYYICSVCGKKFDSSMTEVENVVLPSPGHIYDHTLGTVYPADCKTGALGYTAVPCKNCTDPAAVIYTNFVQPSHVFGEWSVTAVATCKTNGTETRSCVCGLTETRHTAKLAHKYDKIDNKYVCHGCGDSYVVSADGSSVSRPNSTFLNGVDPNFDFYLVHDGDEASLRLSLVIIDSYFEGASSIPDTAFVNYNASLHDADKNIWQITPIHSYTNGMTYLAILSNASAFRDYIGNTIKFKITPDYIDSPEEALERIEFNNNIKHVPTSKIAPDTAPEYYTNPDYTLVTLLDIIDLNIGDVICITAEESLDALITGFGSTDSAIQRAIFGKIVEIYRQPDGSFLVKLMTPAPDEVFTKFNASFKTAVEFGNFVESELKKLEKSAGEAIRDNLMCDEDFAAYLTLVGDAIYNYVAEKDGITIKDSSDKEILNVDVDFYVNGNSIGAEINITVLIPVEFDGQGDGEITVTVKFKNDTMIDIEQVADIEFHWLNVYFDFALIQKTTTAFSFEIDFNYSERLEDGDPFVKNNNTGMVHRPNCRYVSRIKDSTGIGSLEGESKLCSVCNPSPDVLDELYRDMEEEVLSSLKYSDWGKALLKVKDASSNSAITKLVKSIIKNSGVKTASPTVGITIGAVHNYYSVFKLDAELKLILDFKIDASMFFSYEREITRTYGIKNNASGFDTYKTEVIDNEKASLRLLGRLEVRAGVAIDANIGILDLVEIGTEVELGVYARLSGVVGLDSKYSETLDSNQNGIRDDLEGSVFSVYENNAYAAAYYEAGIYSSAMIYAKLFLFRIPLMSTGIEEIPLIKMGYEKVYYDFAFPDEDTNLDGEKLVLEVTNTPDDPTLIDLGRYAVDVLYLDLGAKGSIASGVEALPLDYLADHYTISFSLENENNAYISYGKLYFKDNAENEFDVKVTISINGRDSWKNYKEDNVMFSDGAFDSYTFTLRVKHHDWKVTGYRETTCTSDGFSEYTCSRCGEVKKIVSKATGHNYITIKNLPATCTKYSYTVEECSNCKHLRNVQGNTPPHGMHYGEWHLEGELVEGKDIVLKYICSGCGRVTETRTIGWNNYAGLFIYDTNSDGTYRITGFDSAAYNALGAEIFDLSALIIPSSYKGGDVTSVTSLDSHILFDATSIYIPKTISYLSPIFIDNLTKDYRNLEQITVSPLNKSYSSSFNCLIEKSSDTLLVGCDTSVIPFDGSVAYIASNAFRGRDIEQIVIPKSVKKVYANAFRDCKNLKRVMVFDETSIPYSTPIVNNALAFEGCINLETILFADYSLLESMFCKICIYADSEYSVEYIGDCEHSNEIMGDLSVAVTQYQCSFNSYCMACGEFLTSGMDHDFVKQEDIVPTCTTKGKTEYSICSVCFAENYESIPALGHDWGEVITVLANESIPGKRHHICTRCTHDELISEIPCLPYTDGLIYEYVSYLDGYAVLGIDNKYFSGDTVNITPVYLGKPVVQIDSGAFNSRDDIKKVIIPDSVQAIYSAFKNCSNLEELDLGSVSKIWHGSFAGCTSLVNIDLPDTLTSLANSAFMGTGYSSDADNWDDSVLYIDGWLHYVDSIYGNSGLEYRVKDGTVGISDEAFRNQSQYSSIILPEGLKFIGEFAFRSCTELTSIVIPESLEKLDTSAFSDCSKLEIIYINSPEIAKSFKSSYLCGSLFDYVHTLVFSGDITEIGGYVNTLFPFFCELPTGNSSYKVYSKHDLNGSSVTKQVYIKCQQDGIDVWSCNGCNLELELTLNAHNFDSSYKCVDCSKPAAKFTGANISLGVDISMDYYVTLEEVVTSDDIYVVFNKNGKTYRTEVKSIDGQKLTFRLPAIAPQELNVNITADVYIDGQKVDTKTDFSVVEYCKKLLSRTPEQLGLSEEKYAQLEQLIADLIAYGAAAQDYTNYNTASKPFIEGITPSSFTPIPSKDSTVTPSSVDGLNFTSATLYFYNVNNLLFEFRAADISGVTAKINGKNVEYILKDADNNIYEIKSDDIYAIEFKDIYTVELYKDGVLAQTLTYGVKSYIYAKQSQTDANGNPTPMAILAQRTWNYGLSAIAFASTK